MKVLDFSVYRYSENTFCNSCHHSCLREGGSGFRYYLCYHMKGIWALKPYYVGPWTLRVIVGVYMGAFRTFKFMIRRVLMVGFLLEYMSPYKFLVLGTAI